MATPAVRFNRVTKRFPGVVALNGVSFDVARGSCHAVCGENGAGKSTLGKLLCGIDRADDGTIEIDGRAVLFSDPAEALAAGVAMVHQELASCSNLSVAENLCLGRLPSRWLLVDRAAMHARAKELLADIAPEIDVTKAMSSLSVAEQQLVQIASAVGSGAHIIVFDEPTSSLSEGEAARLYALIPQLTAHGTSLLYVSHRMPEIFRLADHLTVLRDGEHVATRATSELDETELVQLMIGRRLEQYFPAHVSAEPRDELLSVHNLTRPGKFEQISFAPRGRSPRPRRTRRRRTLGDCESALFGLRRSRESGTIRMRGAARDCSLCA